MYNHMVGRTVTVISPFDSLLPAHFSDSRRHFKTLFNHEFTHLKIYIDDIDIAPKFETLIGRP